MRLLLVLLLLAANDQVQAAIEAVYEGANGIRDNVLTVCLQCHSTTVSGAARHDAPVFINFNTYAAAILWGDNAVAQVIARTMPPAGNTPLNTEQKAALVAWQAAGFPESLVPVQDTQKPTTPLGLAAKASGSSEVSLSWTASTDNVGVTAYKVFRGGLQIAAPGNVTSYRDTGVSASTAYSYGVMACDKAENCSALSSPATATTLSREDCLFNWAETFPELFFPPTESRTLSPYYYRFYPPGTYLAITADTLYYLGPLSPTEPLNLQGVSTWYARSGCN